MLLAKARAVVSRPNIRASTEVAQLQVFDRTSGKVLKFITTYKLFLKIRMRGDLVEEQIQQLLSYVQRELVDVQKENILEDLKSEDLEYKIVEEFLAEIRKEFRREDEETMLETNCTCWIIHDGIETKWKRRLS